MIDMSQALEMSTMTPSIFSFFVIMSHDDKYNAVRHYNLRYIVSYNVPANALRGIDFALEESKATQVLDCLSRPTAVFIVTKEKWHYFPQPIRERGFGRHAKIDTYNTRRHYAKVCM